MTPCVPRPWFVAILTTFMIGDGSLLLSGEKRPVPAAKPPTPAAQAVALAAKLAQPVDLRAFDQVPLEEVVAFLGKQYNLNFWIDTAALAEGDDSELAAHKVVSPKLTGVRLDKALLRMLKPLEAGYVLRDGVIEITSLEAIQTEFYPDRPLRYDAAADAAVVGLAGDGVTARRVPFPLVQAAFEDRPLREALRELAQAAGCNVVIADTEASRMKVTAHLTNVPLDTAVHLLAAMAGLEVARLDTVLFVTDNAEGKRSSLLESRRNPGDRLSARPAEPSANTTEFPSVPVALKEVPLDKALRDLAKAAAFPVNLNANAPEAKKPVTADLGSLPLDDAVAVLADMADLRVVRHENFLYVTTPSEADRLSKRFK